MPFWTQLVPGEDPTSATTRVAYSEPSLQYAVQHLESNFEAILKEYEEVAPGLGSDYRTDTEHGSGNSSNGSDKDSKDKETTLHDGQWDWHSFMQKGQIQSRFTDKFPNTSRILNEFRAANLLFEGTPFGYAFFSTLHGNSKIAAHTAPMNWRIRIHLPLLVPNDDDDGGGESNDAAADNGHSGKIGIRVGPIERRWVPGKCLLLDDSYDHEVWNDTSQPRVLLLVDVWHPDVTLKERNDVVRLFRHAQEQGWWSPSSSSS